MNKIQEIHGQRFGHWTVLNDYKYENESVKWECRCDCGIIKYVNQANLIQGKSNSCGCRTHDIYDLNHSLVSQRFGRLVVVRKVKIQDEVKWECICDCGNTTYVGTRLLNRGCVRSCGCLKLDMIRNLTDNTFGDLTVISTIGTFKAYKKLKWECQCSCGKKCIVNHYDLTHHNITNCGCKPEPIKRGKTRNLSGIKIGNINIIRQTAKTDYKGSIIWECVCDCGKTFERSEDSLIHSSNISCGCVKKSNMKNLIFRKGLHFLEGTCLEMIKNRKHRIDNTSGFRGIYHIRNRWRAIITFKQIKYHLGYFDTFEDAVNARLKAENEMYLPFIKKYDVY